MAGHISDTRTFYHVDSTRLADGELTPEDVRRVCGPYVAQQVAAFFNERGLEPVVPKVVAAGGYRPALHGRSEETGEVLCTYWADRSPVLLRPAADNELLWRQCRSCNREYLRRVSRVPTLSELREPML